jgi:hypothetical protein
MHYLLNIIAKERNLFLEVGLPRIFALKLHAELALVSLVHNKVSFWFLILHINQALSRSKIPTEFLWIKEFINTFYNKGNNNINPKDPYQIQEKWFTH